MEKQQCLNCNTLLKGKFCWSCGQTAATHRITPRHFVQHELLHGVWNMDNKILFTLKELFTRPGNAAKDYLAGKRVRYYNIFYLLLIVLGLNLLTIHYAEKSTAIGEINTSGDGVKMMDYLSKNIKLLIFGLIPFFAFNAWLLFRKLKYNFAEHMIIAGFGLLGCAIITLVLNLLDPLVIFAEFETLSLLFSILYFGTPVFLCLFYYQVCKPTYRVYGFGWRIVVFYLLFFTEIVICIYIYGIIFGFHGSVSYS